VQRVRAFWDGSGSQPFSSTASTVRPLPHPCGHAKCHSAFTACRNPPAGIAILLLWVVQPSNNRIVPLPSSHTTDVTHVMSIASPASLTMPELNEVLERLGLTQYLQPLSENGFHSWETVVDITEHDLTTLDFKLGHRRALQREIATYRGVPSSLSLDPEVHSIEPTTLSTSALESLTRQTSTPPPREKRRYRRHPRPDPNAPKKPKTACTIYQLINHAQTQLNNCQM
jgi:hypothetical protein